MDITCPKCSQTLRVGDDDAGKQARCPKCETIFSIPGGSGQGESPDLLGGPGLSSGSQDNQLGSLGQQDQSNPFGEIGQKDPGGLGAGGLGAGGVGAGTGGLGGGANPTAANQATHSPDEQWHLKIEDGRSFGPVPKSELDSWLAENRITGNCFVRRDSESNWQPAAILYPQLGMPAGATNNPFSDQYSPSGQSQPSFQRGGTGYQEPHRGGMILTFGILSIFGCGCIIFLGFGIAAWSMGMSDVKKMDEGRMDPSGRGMTQAGYIMGIIGCVIWGLSMILGFIGMIADM